MASFLACDHSATLRRGHSRLQVRISPFSTNSEAGHEPEGDVGNTSSLEYYAEDGRSLGRYHAPARSDAAGLSFVGAKFDSVAVARVRITAGQGAMGPGIADLSAGGTLDLVAVDDFLYGEPQAGL